MNTKRILNFLTDISKNNNRQWFLEHKAEYQICKDDFEDAVSKAIVAISTFDSEIAHLEPKDCCYRFNRDTRFSEDKSPYKRHFGAYICAHGKKSMRGGYYLHIQPGRCFISVGTYWLPTNILTSIRNEIMTNINDWREAVENGKFVNLYGYANAGTMTDDDMTPKGFCISSLKTCPKGFPKDYEFVEYLRMKDYATWRRVPDNFFEGDKWLDTIVENFKVAKPMLDFVNNVVDDYE
nr:DUF2461 domain-containing protein [Prevotella sp.]